MFTQKSYFKALSLSAFYFIAQTALAIAPHKTGVQFTDAYGAPYPDAWGFWAYFGAGCIGLLAYAAFKMVQGEKQNRYDQ